MKFLNINLILRSPYSLINGYRPDQTLQSHSCLLTRPYSLTHGYRPDLTVSPMATDQTLRSHSWLQIRPHSHLTVSLMATDPTLHPHSYCSCINIRRICLTAVSVAAVMLISQFSRVTLARDWPATADRPQPAPTQPVQMGASNSSR
jgi:hypothetical protein